MAFRKTKFIAIATLLAAGTGGYWLYLANAAQGQGALAQSPLNVQTQVPAAFIMALDDSGSMRFQTLFPSRDGGALWLRDNGSQPYSFFYSSGANAGKLRTSDGERQYVHVAPYPAPRQGSPGDDNAAIPPIDAFGFSRSHVYNRAYFDPNTVYQPWKTHLGTFWPDANPKAVRVDPNSTTPTFDLTVERTSTSTDNSTHHAFRVRGDMVLPAGTKIRTASSCGFTDGNTTESTPSGWRTLNSDVMSTGRCNMHIAYFPATFYLPVDHDAPEGFIEANRVLAVNACTYSTATGSNRCDMYRYEIRPENYDTVAAYNAAIQNFANWFSYYGARNRAVVSGITHALATVNNMRVGYFTINNRTAVTMRDMGVPDEKESFYDSIVTLGASGNTPNLPAVAHMGNQFRRTNAGAPVQLACQRNAGMLFTDGFSNVEQTGYGNIDGAMGEPFQDDHSNTLADIATRFYLDGDRVPLRSGGSFPAGLVPTPDACWTLDDDGTRIRNPNVDPRIDCQSNLHMNFYGVTLGARGVVFDPDVERDPFTEPYISWPAFESNERSTIDDIWHATVNTRGEFINANTPADITQAMRRIIRAVSGDPSTSGTVALTGSRIGERSLTVVPAYATGGDNTDWHSTLTAFKIARDPDTGVITETEIWEASEKLGAMTATTRAGHTWYGGSSGALALNVTNIGAGNLSKFCDTALSGMSRCAAEDLVGLGVNVQQTIDYLLGDSSREVRNGGTLRDRNTSVLGDIINSPPVVSAPTDDYGYRTLPSPYGSSYDTYLTTKKERSAMVYVGANDGMLHAFNGGMDDEGELDAALGGKEEFAFIPRAVLGHMGNLLLPYVPEDGVDQKFDHRYFVDGPLAVGDSYYSGGWKTVLVGTTGAGGRSVFALDVSNPGAFGASSLLWEIDDQHGTEAVRNNIGHVLGKPVIVPVKESGESGAVSWKAIFGNGYNSISGRAVLFVVDIGSGAVRMIEAVESGAPAGSNGLGNILAVDRRNAETGLSVRDGYADTVYAADQKGALWKFDLLSAATSISVPLFTTLVHSDEGVDRRQPILGGLTATAGRGGGVMILFGTGSFSFTGDPTDSSTQTIYGIQDTGGTTTLTRTDLFARVLDASVTPRKITPGGLGFGYSGWYLDLPAKERVISYPRVASGVLFITTYAPSVAHGCSTGGDNWLYGLNTRTGTAALASVRFGSTTGATQGAGVGAVPLVTGGSAPVKELAVNIVSTSRLPPGETQRCWMRITVPGMSQPMFVPYPCGRQSWRQLQ